MITLEKLNINSMIKEFRLREPYDNDYNQDIFPWKRKSEVYHRTS